MTSMGFHPKLLNEKSTGGAKQNIAKLHFNSEIRMLKAYFKYLALIKAEIVTSVGLVTQPESIEHGP